MNRSKRNVSKRVRLEVLSEEELIEFIDSVQTDEESSEDDDSVVDPDYVVDNIETDSSAEHEIHQCIEKMSAEDSSAFVQAMNFSLIDITNVEPAASSTFVAPDNESVTANETVVGSIETVEVEVEDEVQPSTSTAEKEHFKPPKRARSPLPVIEETGPASVPSAGGFILGGKVYIHI